MYLSDYTVTYFDSFGIEYVPNKIKIFINRITITTNVFRIKAYDSIMCGNVCIGFIDFMLNGKTLAYFINPY